MQNALPFRYLIVFVVAISGPDKAGAQTAPQAPQADTQGLTVEAAVNEGLGRSPDIQRARAKKSESEWQHFEALGAGFLPKVSANAHHYFAEEYTQTTISFGGAPLGFPGFYPTDAAAIDVTIPIFDGLSSRRNLEAASLAEEASNAELSHAEFQLRLEIRLAFYKALAATELQAVAAQNVKTLEDHLKQVQNQRGGGVATNYDVLRVQVQLSEARADSIDAQDNFETARKKLTQLLGLEDDQRVLTGHLPLPNADKVKALQWKEVPKEREDIRALNLRAESADEARKANASWLIPSISLGGEYMWYNAQYVTSTVQDTGNYLNAYNFGVFLKWNLFDGGVALAQEREAAFRTIQAENAARSAKLQVPYDFEYWKRRYLSNTDHYTSKQFDIARSQESVRLAKEEERAGERTSTETLDAELDLFRAKAGVVNALVNTLEAEVRLEQVLGREI
jgi:outer membrane protein TolC